MRWLSVVTVSFALAGMIASSAVADSSRVVHDRYFDETTLPNYQSGCSFPVAYHAVADIDDAYFFDRDGNLVRLLETVRNAIITYTVGDRTLQARGSGGFEVLFNPDGSPASVATFGINLLLTIPGQGAVFLDTGRAEFAFHPFRVVFQAGPQSLDVPAFCAALSP
jgi:hypothetical protein